MKARKNLLQAKALIPLLRSVANEVRERSQRLFRFETQRKSFLLANTGEGFVSALEDLDSAIRAENRGIQRALAEIRDLGLELASTQPLIVHIPGRTPGGDVVFSWEENKAGNRFRQTEETQDEASQTGSA